MILKHYQHCRLSLVLKKVAQLQLTLPLLLLDEGIRNANTDLSYGIDQTVSVKQKLNSVETVTT